jgi:hypothetical protein
VTTGACLAVITKREILIPATNPTLIARFSGQSVQHLTHSDTHTHHVTSDHITFGYTHA